jgi:hypothetical protein
MQSKEFQRLISRGMPNSIGAAEAWREAALKVPPKKRQAGSAKRVRQEGELTAKQMAEALGICEQSVYMYWTAGMPRTSVEALAWREDNRRRPIPVSDASDHSNDAGNYSSDSESSLDADILMPGHPSGTQGNKGLTAGCISEFQMMFAELAVADGKFENVGLAISEMEMRQAQNKLDMEELLKELDIDRGLAGATDATDLLACYTRLSMPEPQRTFSASPPSSTCIPIARRSPTLLPSAWQ